MRIADALAEPALPRLERQLLLAHAVGHPAPARASAWLLAHDDHTLTPAERMAFETAVARRRAGEPVAYILGRREFYGRDFLCSPAALIPRPETEHLVEQVLALLPPAVPGQAAPTLLDVGTGTGCIAITLALERPAAEVVAVDVSEDALALARRNADALGAGRMRFIRSNWLSEVPAAMRFDLIVSNPPYVRGGDPHLFQGDLRFEPWLALTDRADGLTAYRILAAATATHLRPGGHLLVEHAHDQAEAVGAIFAAAGLTAIATTTDLAGLPRVTLARLPA